MQGEFPDTETCRKLLQERIRQLTGDPSVEITKLEVEPYKIPERMMNILQEFYQLCHKKER